MPAAAIQPRSFFVTGKCEPLAEHSRQNVRGGLFNPEVRAAIADGFAGDYTNGVTPGVAISGTGMSASQASVFGPSTSCESIASCQVSVRPV